MAELKPISCHAVCCLLYFDFPRNHSNGSKDACPRRMIQKSLFLKMFFDKRCSVDSGQIAKEFTRNWEQGLKYLLLHDDEQHVLHYSSHDYPIFKGDRRPLSRSFCSIIRRCRKQPPRTPKRWESGSGREEGTKRCSSSYHVGENDGTLTII